MTSTQSTGSDRGGMADLALSATERDLDELWPLMRSISGEGLERSLAILGRRIPLTWHRFRSGTPVLDWVVPPVWRFRGARLVGPGGETICDAADHTLHIVSYSAPFRGDLTLAELQLHLHSVPDLPDAIPYRTTYYERDWGFCLPHSRRAALRDGIYRVEIDTEFDDRGEFTMADCLLPGDSAEEILITSYLCHPSMVSNELSGPLALALIYESLCRRPTRRYSYRFLLSVETIGAIAYLSRFGRHLKRHVASGMVLTCLGGPGAFTYKMSRSGRSRLDSLMRQFGQEDGDLRIRPFFPNGSDERQFCSPGFDLPMGAVARDWPGEFREYHTSLDDRRYAPAATITTAADFVLEVLDRLEADVVPISNFPFGEPMLGRHKLLQGPGGSTDPAARQVALKWLLNQADGTKSLSAIAARAGVPFHSVEAAYTACHRAGLVREGGWCEAERTRSQWDAEIERFDG